MKLNEFTNIVTFFPLLTGIYRIAAQITSSDRRSIQRSKRIKSMSTDKISLNDNDGTAKNELDTRADTSCLGKNWRYISDEKQVCTVSGFHSTFKSLREVPIVRAATGWIDPSTGESYLLFINQGLWFGEDLDHSLINPNQIRHFGIPVHDNCYDNSKPVGISHSDVLIPFKSTGATVYFETFRPTEEQLHDETFTHIELTDGRREWDPQMLVMEPNRPYGEHGAVINEIKTDPALPRPIQSKLPDHEMFETDMVLNEVSVTLNPQLLRSRMISSVVVGSDDVRRVHSAATTPRETKTVSIQESFSKDKHSTYNPEHVGKIFGVSLDKARRTLDMTTQHAVRHANLGLHKRYRTARLLGMDKNRLDGRFYMDWLSSNVKSVQGNKGAFVITNGAYTESYAKPTRNAANATDALREFVTDVGAPDELKVDSAPEFIGKNTETVKYCRRNGIDVTYAEPHRKNEIAPADTAIREIKKFWQYKKCNKDIPSRVWDFGLTHASQIATVSPIDGKMTGYESVLHKKPDISALLDFDFWDLVWYLKGDHPSVGDNAKELGRWLGISRKVGAALTYFIMTKDGKVISESTVQKVTQEDMKNEDTKTMVSEFNSNLRAKLNDEAHVIKDDYYNQLADNNIGLLARIAAEEGHTVEGNGNDEEATNHYFNEEETDIGVLDKYIGAQIKLDGPEGSQLATVKRRVTDGRGKPVGTANDNPLLDSRQYEIELEDGSIERYQANTIAENIYAQTDDEGRVSIMLDEIYGHRKDGRAVSMANGFTRNNAGEPRPKITTAGWFIKMRWKDGSTDELPLRLVKESNPIELAEYAVAAGIMDEPAFKWWVPFVLKKRHRMINKAKSKYWRTTTKFGIKVPKDVEEALKFDDENENTFWRDAIVKEMKNVKIAYRPYEDHTPDDARKGKVKSLTGYTEIKCRIIFDVKMNFDRKARFVAGGHMTDTPPCMTYSSVVSRDSVRLAFLIAALNGLDVSACDIGNAYLNAECREKIWFEAGIECGEDAGKIMIIERALYGKS